MTVTLTVSEHTLSGCGVVLQKNRRIFYRNVPCRQHSVRSDHMMNINRLDSYTEVQRIGFESIGFDLRDGAFTDLLMDGIGRGVIFVNNDGVLTSINRYAAVLLQVKKEAVIGKRVDMLSLRTPLYRVLSEQRTDTP